MLYNGLIRVVISLRFIMWNRYEYYDPLLDIIIGDHFDFELLGFDCH